MKKFLKISGIILLIKICIGFALLFYANIRLKEGIESIDSEYFGASFKVEKIVIHALDGSIEIGGIQVANPPGFSNTHIFETSKILLNFQIWSLLEPVIIIDKVEVIAPKFFYETISRKNNIDTLKSIVSKQLATEPIRHPEKHAPVEPKFYDFSKKKVIITEFNMAESITKLRIDHKIALFSNIKLDEKLIIPKIVIKNIGKSKGGITPEQAAELIGLKVLKSVPVTEINRIIFSPITNQVKNITNTLEGFGNIISSMTK